MIPTENRSRAFWICAIVTNLNALVSAGFSVARLLGPEGGEVALYAASRSVALLLVVLGVASLHSRAGVAALACVMGLVQLFDTGIGVLAHELGQRPWPADLRGGHFCVGFLSSAGDLGRLSALRCGEITHSLAVMAG